MSFIKEEARKIVEDLPEDATGDDLMYQVYVKLRVENALEEIEDGQTVSN